MPVTKDDVTYDQLHERLLRDMLLAIKDELDDAELDHDEVHQLTANIALAISSILDGTSPMTLNGRRLLPVLAFGEEGRPDDDLIVNGQGSYLHEIVDTLFEQMEQEEDEDEDEEEEDEDDFDYEEDDDEEDGEDEEEEEDDEDADDPRRH